MKSLIGLLVIGSVSAFASSSNSIEYNKVLDTIKEDIDLYQRSVPLTDKKNTCYHLGRIEQFTSLLQSDVESKVDEKSLRRRSKRHIRRVKRKSRDKTNFCSSKLRLIFGGLERDRVSHRMYKAEKRLNRFESKLSKRTSYPLNSGEVINDLITMSENIPFYKRAIRFKPEACYNLGMVSSQAELLEESLNDSLKQNEHFLNLKASIEVIKVDVCRGYYMENTYNKYMKRILKSAIKLKGIIK